MSENRFLNSMVMANSEGSLHIFNRDAINHNETTTQPDMKTQGYVEWYWVVLGLTIPILLGALFCLMDHFRRRKHTRKYTERRLERMCERNKVEPPPYEASAVHVDEYATTKNIPVQPAENSSPRASPIIQTLPLASINHVHIQMDGTVALSDSQNDTSANENPIDSSAVIRMQLPSEDSVLTPEEPSNNQISSDNIQDSQDGLEDIDVKEGPPSYEEYHLYEVYGSTTQLV